MKKCDIKQLVNFEVELDNDLNNNFNDMIMEMDNEIFS